MKKWFGYSSLAFFGFVGMAFLPNVLTDRQDKQMVKDATATTFKTGVSLAGGAWNSVKDEWIANHNPTVLPQDGTTAKPIVVVIQSVDGKEIAVTQQD